MKVFLDGSVVRRPASGVQASVRRELLSLFETPDLGDATVFCLDETVRRAAVDAGAAVGELSGLTRRVLIRILWQQRVLPRLLKRGGVDLLHAFAYTAPLRCPVPYVLNVHDLIALQRPDLCSRANVWHMRMLMPGSIRGAAANIVSSSSVAAQLTELLEVPSARIHCVPLGVDFESFADPAVRPGRLPVPPDRPYLLFVGNIEPKKGLETLVDAYAEAADRIGCDLVLAGRAAWKSKPILARIADCGKRGGIRLLGRVADVDLPGLYQHAWAFAFPSVIEGFGLPVLEAMAAGAPVVHSDHEVLMETAGGAGLPFALGDAADLARALLRLHESSALRDELREKGRERARSLPWSRWAAQVREIQRQTGAERP